MSEPCLICSKPVYDYDPMMCCSGYECGCMGKPTVPCCCSGKCEDAVYKYIGMKFDERRKAANIEIYKGE